MPDYLNAFGFRRRANNISNNFILQNLLSLDLPTVTLEVTVSIDQSFTAGRIRELAAATENLQDSALVYGLMTRSTL